jgi:hypothetical protein
MTSTLIEAATPPSFVAIEQKIIICENSKIDALVHCIGEYFFIGYTYPYHFWSVFVEP